MPKPMPKFIAERMDKGKMKPGSVMPAKKKGKKKRKGKKRLPPAGY